MNTNMNMHHNPYDAQAQAPVKKLWGVRLYLLLLAINCAAYAAVWVTSGYASPSNAQLLGWGANFAPLTLGDEPWRLLTSMFLHANWIHLLMNMYMLVILGGVLERAMGSWRFGVVYLLSGLAGSLASAFWFSPYTGHHAVVSIGASGALMGLAGAAAVLAWRFPSGWPPGDSVRISRQAIVQVVAINLVYGFLTVGIDQAAHCGGLLMGAAAVWVLCRK